MSDLIMPEAFTQTNRKARKQHKCCECHKNIEIGEIYEYTSGIWEGEPDSYKTCRSCLEVKEDYENCTGEKVAFGMLSEVISDCCFYKDYGAKEYIADYPQLKTNLERLFNIGGKDE